MTWVKHNIRLSPAQDRALVGYAEQRGLTRYKMLAAHAAAVRTALSHVERHMAATRIRADGVASREVTGKLAIASFLHITSRAQDPQLHTHNVILNMTKGADGVWSIRR